MQIIEPLPIPFEKYFFSNYTIYNIPVTTFSIVVLKNEKLEFLRAYKIENPFEHFQNEDNFLIESERIEQVLILPVKNLEVSEVDDLISKINQADFIKCK